MFRLHGKKQAPKGAPKKARPLASRLDRQAVAKKSPAERARKPWRGKALRLAGKALGLAAMFALVGAVLVGGWAWVADRPAFAVQEAQVLGTHHLSRLEVLSTLGVGTHSSLLSLNVGRLEELLTRRPWVAEAKVERRLPGTVRVTVTERRPSFLALVEGRLYFLDEDMASFAPLGPGEPAPDMPVITGLSRADLVSPDAPARQMMATARKLWQALNPADRRAGGGLSEVHLDRAMGVTCVWNNLEAPVVLGFDGFAAKLDRLCRVAADLERRGELERVVRIDLDAPGRAVVRLAGDPA